MESHLHWADYLILVGFLVFSLAIGIYHSLTGGRQKTVAEFILANRRLKVIPTAISMLVSFQSAISLLGRTAEMYSYGIQYLIYVNVSLVIAIVAAERLIVPWLYPLKLVSVYEYLERRYMSKSIRIFGASMGILSGVLYMGVAMYAPSAALESATGLPLSVSIPVMAVVSVTYTALGGMRAVIWTDVFQFCAMVGGITAILVRGFIITGGVTNVFRLAGEEGRLELANFSFDPRERHTVWSLVIGSGLSWFCIYGLSQSSVQRYSAVTKLSKARATILLNMLPIILMTSTACIIGLIVLAYYSSIQCDPLANKDIKNPNQLLPYFVVTIFSDAPGFAGLFLSALYGGALSSLSSWLSGAAANCWEDILKWKLSYLPETKKALINRFLVVLFGTISIGVAFFSASVPGPVTQVMMAMLNSASGPLMALFILGGVSRHANWKGMLLGGIVGISVTMWLCFGSMTVRYNYPLPPVSVEQCSIGNGSLTLLPSSSNYTSFDVLDGIGAKDNWNQTTEALPRARSRATQLKGLENFYAISYMWFLPFGAIVTGVIGIIASLIMRDRELEAKVDERLLMRFYGCGWSDKNETKNLPNDENYASPKETKATEEAKGESLNGIEMTVSKETENGFHNIHNGDFGSDTENGLPVKEDSRRAPLLWGTA